MLYLQVSFMLKDMFNIPCGGGIKGLFFPTKLKQFSRLPVHSTLEYVLHYNIVLYAAEDIYSDVKLSHFTFRYVTRILNEVFRKVNEM